MYVTARESFGLLTVRKVGECKKDCGQGECAIKILYVEKTWGHFGNRLCT